MKDHAYNKTKGPGMYNMADQPLSDKRKTISWNFGAVPFGSGNERFKAQRTNFAVGPGNYSPDRLNVTKPIPLKPQSIQEVH